MASPKKKATTPRGPGRGRREFPLAEEEAQKGPGEDPQEEGQEGVGPKPSPQSPKELHVPVAHGHGFLFFLLGEGAEGPVKPPGEGEPPGGEEASLKAFQEVQA